MVAVERRRRPVATSAWELLENRDDFWQLEERGVVKVRRRGAQRVELEGTRYVGRAQFGDVLLQIDEKIAGALASLISFATYDAFRVEAAESPASDLGSLMRLLIEAFVQRAREYVGRGVDWRYSSRREAGSLVAGRLDVEGTIKLRALGRKHQAAFLRPVIDRNQPLNRVVLAALRQVERLATLITMAPRDLARARGVSQYLDEARTTAVLFGARAEWVAAAQRLADAEQDAGRRDLASLAAVVLSHQSFEFGAAELERVPRSWFLNLESLFEEAVRRRLRAAMTKHSVRRSNLPAIFTGADAFRADPDIVVRRKDSDACIAVGDAKYKDWPGDTTESLHSDLYQLLVHAAAFGAPRAFLLYPDDHFAERRIGVSVTGCEAWLFAVDIRNLDESMTEVAKRLS